MLELKSLSLVRAVLFLELQIFLMAEKVVRAFWILLLIFIAIIDFSCFVLISAKNVMDKGLALFLIKGEEFKGNF